MGAITSFYSFSQECATTNSILPMMKLVLAFTLLVTLAHGAPLSEEEIQANAMEFCEDMATGNTEAAAVLDAAIAYQCNPANKDQDPCIKLKAGKAAGLEALAKKMCNRNIFTLAILSNKMLILEQFLE